MDISPNKILMKRIEEAYDNRMSVQYWSGSDYEKIDALKADESGDCGELIAVDFWEAAGYTVGHGGTKILEGGTFDLPITDSLGRQLNIEWKTARASSDEKLNFQHESLRLDGSCDGFGFLDIEPTGVFVTVMAADFDGSARHKVIGRKPHKRKGSTNIFKLDWNANNLTRKKGAIAAGIAMRITKDTKMSEVKSFLKRRFDAIYNEVKGK